MQKWTIAGKGKREGRWRRKKLGPFNESCPIVPYLLEKQGRWLKKQGSKAFWIVLTCEEETYFTEVAKRIGLRDSCQAATALIQPFLSASVAQSGVVTVVPYASPTAGKDWRLCVYFRDLNNDPK